MCSLSGETCRNEISRGAANSGWVLQIRRESAITSLRDAPLARSTNTIDRPSGSQSGQFTVFGSARIALRSCRWRT